MIVLRILLYILLVVAAILLFVLIVPAGGEYSYIDGKFKYTIKVWFLNFMDSEGGGLFRWWKKRKANKKDKPEKFKKPKPVKSKKSKKKKQREQYEWEKELEDIPVNNLAADAVAAENTAETVTETAADLAEKSDINEKSEGSVKADTSSDEKKKSSDDEIDDISDDDDDEKSSISDKIEKLIGLWESVQRPALKIMKGFRIYDLYIDFVIADEDAYKCALNYGRYSTAIFNGLAFFSEIFTIRFKTVDVRPQFGASKGRWDTSGKFAFRLGTLVIAGAWFLITYLFRTVLPEKIRKRKMKKSAARQK